MDVTPPRGAPVSAGAPVAARAQGLTLHQGRTLALDASDFTLEAGTLTCLIGPNGSGKTTILHVLCGLLAPTAGTLEVLGGSAVAARRRVAVVFQSVHANERLPLTVTEAVTIGRYTALGPLRRQRADDRDAIERAMERLAITDLRRRSIDELSGGQRQRVLVAQGLAQEGDMLLLDEPVTGLDGPSRERILAVIDEERALGRTVVLSTHELSDAAQADTVLLLAGRVVAAGPPAQVLTADNLTVAYAGQIIRVGPDALLFDESRRSAHDGLHHHP